MTNILTIHFTSFFTEVKDKKIKRHDKKVLYSNVTNSFTPVNEADQYKTQTVST